MVVLLVSVHKRDLLHRWRRGCVPGLPTRQFIRPRGTEPSRVHRWVAGSVSMCVEGGRRGGGHRCVAGKCVSVCGGRAAGGWGVCGWLVVCLRVWGEGGGGGHRCVAGTVPTFVEGARRGGGGIGGWLVVCLCVWRAGGADGLRTAFAQHLQLRTSGPAAQQ